MTDSIADVLIIGAGPAGLSAALTLARQCHSAIVFDTKQYRTDVGQKQPKIHVLSGWDGRSPADYRAKAREEIAIYNTIAFCDQEVISIFRNSDNIFEARDSNGTLHYGRKVILAHGVQEIYPGIPGYVECWGTGM